MNTVQRRAKGKIREPGSMNQTERRYAEILEARRLVGEVVWWKFEAIALRLADPKCFFHPDFLIMLTDGTLEVHEVKGAYTARMDDGGIIKLKVAAAHFPFVFRKCTWAKGEWSIEEVGAKTEQRRRENPENGTKSPNSPNNGIRSAPAVAAQRMALVNGKPVPYEEALAMIAPKKSA